MAIYQKDYQKEESINHKILIAGRNSGAVTGVKDVISFDLEEIILETVMGILNIKGNNLHVRSINLDKGQVDMEGTIDSMVYSDTKMMKKQSFVGRLFK